MKVSELKRGLKIKNQHGETLTILEVVGGVMVRTYEDFNNPHPYTKLFYNGKTIEA